MGDSSLYVREPHQHLRQHSIFGDLRQGKITLVLSSASSPESNLSCNKCLWWLAGKCAGPTSRPPFTCHNNTTSLSFGSRIDPLWTITRRRLQVESLSASPKSWNHERETPQQSLGARSNLDWLVLELLHARCHRLYTMPYFINCQIAFMIKSSRLNKGSRHFTGHPSHETEVQNPSFLLGFFLYVNCLSIYKTV